MKGAVVLMTASKGTAIAAGLALAILLGAAATLLLLPGSPPPPAAVAGRPPTRPAAVAAPAIGEPYGLAAGQDLKRVPPPFPPSRLAWYRATYPGEGSATIEGPNAMVVTVGGRPLRRPRMIFGGPWSLSDVLTEVTGFWPQQVEGDAGLLGVKLPGDFVARAGTPPDRLAVALAAMLRDEFRTPAVLSFHDVIRPVIVLRGTWRRRHTVQFYGADLNTERGAGGGGSGTQQEFAQWLGRWVGREVVLDVTGSPWRPDWELNGDGDGTDRSRSLAHDLGLVLGHVAEQTGLTWAEERRTVRRLFVERSGPAVGPTP